MLGVRTIQPALNHRQHGRHGRASDVSLIRYIRCCRVVAEAAVKGHFTWMRPRTGAEWEGTCFPHRSTQPPTTSV
ncbi:hypothetical protein QE152_g13124 [Popillia japonica]|uniref:Uncharacterized protein n=1 Tax=Popillia japonica TaxID=7064 RepID=A0AAW1LGC8_POPJA